MTRSLQSMPDPQPDAVLVRATQQGDTRAYAELVRRYRDRHARFATRMLGSRDDAEDVMQSVFLRAFRHIGRCEEPERFGSWLHRIVVNECRSYGTRRGIRDRRLVRDETAFAGMSTDPVVPDTGLRAEIDRALDGLPSEQREAFLLKHVEEMSYEEMAEVTGAGVSALKMRVKRACEQLRERLEGVIDA
jgi:RNA polymerase sigma-70 factor (ECF subfamily)